LTPFGRNLYEPKYNSSEFFDFVKNRLADYSSFLTEELNKDLEVHSVALVHPNFCYAKTSLNPDVIFNFWITYFLLEKETKERGLVLRTFSTPNRQKRKLY